MNTKLKGSRLEAENDKCRGECNWERLSDLLPAIRLKSSGIEYLSNLIEGELLLEKFLEQESDACFSKETNSDFLRGAETLLQNAVITNENEPTIVMEAYLLLAKLHFFCDKYNEALQDIKKSKIDAAKTQFITLRSLKLAAESYAIKGFSLEKSDQKCAKKKHDKARIINCFETSVNLAISYIAELQKTMNSKPRSVTTISIGVNLRNLKIGKLLEMALERAPYLSLRKNIEDRRWDMDGIEWYRRIMTELSDKSMVEHVQQKLCRQLAEVLIRGMLESGYEFASRAINLKSKSLNFYTGSNTNYFEPKSRFEEEILLLMISEIIASQIAKINRTHREQENDNDTNDDRMPINNLKLVHNLLVFVLSNLWQYNLLSLIYERSMDFANEDRHMWFQFSLTLICDNHFVRAIRTLEHCATLNDLEKVHNCNNNSCDPFLHNGCYDTCLGNEEEIVEQMLAARVHLEQLGDPTKALIAAKKAVTMSTGSWLAGRCMTLFAFALSEKAEREVSFEARKLLINQSIESFERAIELDPHDDLAHFFCALEYALARNLNAAQEHCQRALELNVENPSALMLMALLFTSKRDYKSALDLVINALSDFPSHYGLLVLRLKLEAKYEALQTSKNLLTFWRKISNVSTDFMSNASTINFDEHNTTHIRQNNDGVNGGATPINIDTSYSTNIFKTPKQGFSTTSVVAGSTGQKLSGKEALVPATPMFTAPLGIAASSHISLAASCLDMTELNSAATIATNLSEYGGTISTVSDSMGVMSSSSKSYIRFPAFQIQANIWVELAEFLLEVDRTADVQTCVEEVCAIYPNSYSHQALYLKGRLFLARGLEKGESADNALNRRLRAEAKNCFIGALSIFPAHTSSLLYLSKVYASDGNLKMAEKVLRDIIDIDPLNHKYWHDLGRILAEQRRIEEANECFRTAGSLSFNTPIIAFSAIPRLLKPCLNT